MRGTFVAAFAAFLLSCNFKPVEEAPLTCGAGTHEDSGQCVPDTHLLMCGPGTHASADACIPDVTCGMGTTVSNGQCTATGQQCGTGTHVEGAQCVPDVVTGGCGTGTHESMGACVADVVCGAGTQAQGGQCVPSGGLSCGVGTADVDGVCESNLTCGSGTTLQNGQCVLSTGAWYDVRIATLSVPADGYSVVPVLAIGRQANGDPALDDVVFTLTRLSAGTLTPDHATLTALGANILLTPCASTSANCLGPARITIALASNPSVPIATSEQFNLVAPTGVGTDANCLAYPQALFFNGQSYIFTGMQLVTQGTFTASGAPFGGGAVEVRVTPSDMNMGSDWSLDFAPPQGLTLGAQVYQGATRYPFQAPTEPGFDISGNGAGCNMEDGAFQIETLTWDGGTIVELVATFEQHCEDQASDVLRGCVRYTP